MSYSTEVFERPQFHPEIGWLEIKIRLMRRHSVFKFGGDTAQQLDGVVTFNVWRFALRQVIERRQLGFGQSQKGAAFQQVRRDADPRAD